MHINLLKNALVDIAGKNAADVVDLLYGKRNVNEFIIAKKLKLTINQTRHILYGLSNSGLISFIRKKDKRKGWYTYFWTLNIEKSLIFLKEKLKKEINHLERQLKSRQTKRFYMCQTCGIETTEENALLHEFTCPECGEVYELQESTKIMNELKNKLSKLSGQLALIDEDLDDMRVKKSKKLERERKKEIAKKKKARKKPAKKKTKKTKMSKKKTKKKPKKNVRKKPTKKKPKKTKISKKKIKKKPKKK